MTGEFERIAEIQRRLGTRDARVLLGIGDDAAILEASACGTVLSVDAQVEGVHFRRELLSLVDIGYRAYVAALSDLAAMGARPRAALSSLVLPAVLTDEELYSVVDGIAQAQARYRCPVVGGNLSAGPALILTTTVIGDAPDRPLLRSGAKPGDQLYVTGELGSAALGLRALLAGRSELAPGCVARWRRPTARIEQGERLLGLASAAIDVSDGLLADLRHLCTASSVGCDLEVDRLPLAPELAPACTALGLDPMALALGGGEDYELLFSASESQVGIAIGTMTQAPGVRLRDAAGRELPLPETLGFDHFRSR